MAERNDSSVLTAPLRGAASVLRKVPGAPAVGRAAEETLDKVGAVSPRGRRIAVYAGAGVLGAAGVVEWPVALTGAAVAWLTQPRPAQREAAAPLEETAQRPHDLGTAALRSGPETHEHGPEHGHGHRQEHGHGKKHGHGHTGEDEAPGADAPKKMTGPLGPTARPDRTTR
ncbi:hypothetical protein HZZ00_12905 [Streptomyces sp. NEAU-sy36]|uniref:hypothetical protein n=1 Tax=unclassified Streptomyces TaxID=2593676 RepID=UPI0015D5853C|nr:MULTISPECIES: hypothetical protein [unclassified Streptomyces]QLJ01836.1 hypothetical protein HZZ00_12905 [Streptomyces sp. NEAU-sy36]